MKKKIALLLVTIMITGLVGCGNAETNVTTAEVDSQEEAVEESSQDAEEHKEAEATIEEDTETSEEIDVEEEALDVDEAVEDETPAPVHNGFVSAEQVRDEMVFGWSLGNTLDAYVGNAGEVRNDGMSTETCWGNPKATQTLIDGVKATGINVIRIPITWYTHMDKNTYEIDSEWMDRVEEIVNYALDGKTYVIINVHHDTGTNGWLKASDANLDEKKKIFTAIWTQVATRFAEYDEYLLFEGFNEILNDNDEWVSPDRRALEIVDELNQMFVDTVRATEGKNSNRVLIINSYCAGATVKMLGTFKVPTDTATDALLAEVHAYTPYYFTAPERPDVTTWDKGDVASTISYVGSRFNGLGIPVIIGEFGAVPKNNADEVIAWATYYLEKANYQGIKCMWWDNGIESEFAIFDRNTGEPTKPELLNAMLETVKGK